LGVVVSGVGHVWGLYNIIHYNNVRELSGEEEFEWKIDMSRYKSGMRIWNS